MARKQSPPRPPKPVYCFIVEGCTEENYLNLLKKIYRKGAVIENCKGGEANGVMKKAESIIQRQGENYSGYVIWFDEDRFYPGDTNLKVHLVAIASVKIYISQPCIERWLLAHFQSIKSQPNEACKFYHTENTLKKYIPHYEKDDTHQLDRYIDQTKIETAIKNYPELGEMPKKYFCGTDDPQPQLPAAQLPQQTYLTRIDQFYSQVKDWLKQHNLTVTETKTVDVTDNTGEYVAPVLSILKPNWSESDGMVAELLPQGTSVYTEGLIKLVGVIDAEESITYRLANGVEPEGWYWVETSHHKAYLMDESRFGELLYMVSDYQ